MTMKLKKIIIKELKFFWKNNLNDNNKTKLPKKDKILEIKKLNLQNIKNISIPLHSKNIIEKNIIKLKIVIDKKSIIFFHLYKI